MNRFLLALVLFTSCGENEGEKVCQAQRKRKKFAMNFDEKERETLLPLLLCTHKQTAKWRRILMQIKSEDFEQLFFVCGTGGGEEFYRGTLIKGRRCLYQVKRGRD